MAPPSITQIRSAFCTVDSRCAMTMTVLPCSKRSIACRTMVSLWASSALVASSRIRIGEFFTKARAMAMRCRCPPDIISPPWPTIVS
mmetsp:Transcript_1241/g.2919  ORF Transcript_1241/g.2919 Transcript_1241/m.2919 type:complete len:87 (+) Transcript_1241:329-589(+)